MLYFTSFNIKWAFVKFMIYIWSTEIPVGEERGCRWILLPGHKWGRMVKMQSSDHGSV